LLRTSKLPADDPHVTRVSMNHAPEFSRGMEKALKDPENEHRAQPG
jgi:hypothetical protein